MSQFESNLSEGSVARRLIVFALPVLLSNIVQSLYSVADMLIVGNFAGTASMSAVNIGGQVTFIVTNAVFGLCLGGTVLIAQYLGAGEREKMRRTISTLVTGLLILGVVCTAGLLSLRDASLRLIRTPEESFAEASEYLFVTILGIVFIFGYNALSAILRGMGDSKRPFYFVLIACVTNILLDILFVGPMQMGARGAAIATVISQGVSMLLCVGYLIRNKFIFDFRLRSYRIYREQLGLIFKIGTPNAIQNAVVSVSFMFITALVNTIGGYTASAAVGVVGKFNGFAIMPALAMSSAISTMAAQNIGAGKWDRAVKSLRIGTLIAVVISYSIFAVAQLFPEFILRLFDRDPEMIAYGVSYMRSFSLDYLIVPLCFCFNGLYMGSGHTTFTLINGMLSSLLFRIPASYLFGVVCDWGLFGVGLGGPAASLGALILIIIYYFSGRWKVNVVHHGAAPGKAA
ncbi:MAG: MATE family efflux transporter [Eubacteriales bacterium]|nr:MATE family efflux transporter [Eubacteriales bacterium]